MKTIDSKGRELIKITPMQINGDEVNSVNARTIHEYLEVGTKFSDWIKRAIEKYDFEENKDFTVLKNGNGNNAFIEYIVILDMAKELCMLENNPKGKETRKYFISIEKQSKRVLTTSEQIVLLAQGHQETERRIVALEQTKRLENWQEKSLQDAKNKKVYEIAKDDKEFASKLHRKVWSLFKKKFNLPRYNELPAIKFDDGLEFINSLNIADMVA